MKKLMILFASILSLGAAQLYADTTTPRLGLVEPTIGSTGWGVKINANMAIVDSGTAVLGQANVFTAANTFQAITATTASFTNLNVASSGTVSGNFLITGIISAGSTPLAITTSDGHLDATKLTGTVAGVINNQATLQSGSTFYVSSGTVNTSFQVLGATLNVNGVHYNWPASQGGASTNIQNDGSGNLTWVAPAGGGTVNSGTANQIAFYPSAGTTISSTGTISVFPSSTTIGDATHAVRLSSTTTLGANIVANSHLVTGLPAITIQRFTSGSGTYTTPTSPAANYLIVRMVGGGGGGSGSGTSAGTAPGDGGSTTFGGTAVAGGGVKGAWNTGLGGAGGSNTTDGTAIVNAAGARGQGSNEATSTSQVFAGPMGGVSYFGGAGAGFTSNLSAVANSGSGGGAPSMTNLSSGDSGSAGGAGGYMEILYTSPSATYAYAVGASGSAGGAGTGGSAGGAGGSGVIIVEEHYQ